MLLSSVNNVMDEKGDAIDKGDRIEGKFYTWQDC